MHANKHHGVTSSVALGYCCGHHVSDKMVIPYKDIV